MHIYAPARKVSSSQKLKTGNELAVTNLYTSGKMFYVGQNHILLTDCTLKHCSDPLAQEWVACDICCSWYHCSCVGVAGLSEAKENDFIRK